MKNILIIGAGRSASSLIRYMLEHSMKENWNVTVADVSVDLAKQKTVGHSKARAIAFDVSDEKQRQKEIKNSDIVISMLPASLHLVVAKDCLQFKKHLVTASYVSKEIAAMDKDAKKAGIILMNEVGLDPGIDHASAMKVIDHIKETGGILNSFKSYCGGLVAPESNDNPWSYKFTWNPRNVILAGTGTAQYIEEGHYKFIPYNRLFLQTEKVNVENHGFFEAYANRDSLSYRKAYGIDHIPTMLRGTLRNEGYCKAWNVFVKMGLTDDSYRITNSVDLTYRQLTESLLPFGNDTLEKKIKTLMGSDADSESIDKVIWTGILENNKIPIVNASPAQILQCLLEEKWKLQTQDKDMIVMQHEFEFTNTEKKSKKIISSLVVVGEDQVYTAMAKTVGLPAAITAKLILQGKINSRGVVIPTLKEIYEPLLLELEMHGIEFKEKSL